MYSKKKGNALPRISRVAETNLATLPDTAPRLQRHLLTTFVISVSQNELQASVLMFLRPWLL